MVWYEAERTSALELKYVAALNEETNQRLPTQNRCLITSVGMSWQMNRESLGRLGRDEAMPLLIDFKAAAGLIGVGVSTGGYAG